MGMRAHMYEYIYKYIYFKMAAYQNHDTAWLWYGMKMDAVYGAMFVGYALEEKKYSHSPLW